MKSVSTNAKLKLNKEVVVKLKISEGINPKNELKRKAIFGCCDWLSYNPSGYGFHVND